MQTSASPTWDAWLELSALLPSDLDLDALARAHGAVERQRGDGIIDGTSLFRAALAARVSRRRPSGRVRTAWRNSVANL